MSFSYGPNPRQVLSVYKPVSEAGATPVVIFFYGGFWRTGKREDYQFVGQSLAARGILTIIPDYTLFPAGSYPTFLDDAAAAVGWAHSHASSYGGDPNRLFLMGHSSGAYMAVMLALDPEYLSHVNLTPGNLAGVVGIAGLYRVDHAPADIAPVFVDIHDPDQADPARWVTGKNPPMLLMVGSHDETVDSSNTIDLDKLIESKGGRSRLITYPDLGHIGIMLPFSPAFHKKSSVVDDVASFITTGQ